MMKSLHSIIYSALIAITFFDISCSRPDTFTLDGSVKGADNESLVLERPGFNGSWIAVDSTRTNSSGEFSIICESPEAPEIFRLRLGEKYIYFPVDSTETISLSTTLPGFGSDYRFSGSEAAEKLRKFDMESVQAHNAGGDALREFKRKTVSDIILPGQGNILSYYVLTRTIGGEPLFSVTDPEDAGIFGAVANMYAQYRPEDPRTEMLAAMASEARKNKNKSMGRKTLLRAEESAMIDFSLPDKDGNEITLSGLAGKGKPVMLIFSPLLHERAPEINRRIASLYSKYGNSVTFLHVSPDADRIAWREAALNLPWIVVVDTRGTGSPLLASYNVEVLPSFYFYNKAGELVKSTRDIAQTDGILSSL